MSSLVRNDALVDGNKRLGWTATKLFLMLNGYTLSCTEDEAYELALPSSPVSYRVNPIVSGRRVPPS
jgi:death-on-curing protein